MKKVKKLVMEDFSKYGQFADVLKPTAYYLEGPKHKFYRDMLHFSPDPTVPLCFSALWVKANPGFIIEGMEYHNYTGEIQMPMDDDGILTVAPANGGEINADEVEAFIIPKGTMIILNAGVWHDLMYPKNNEYINVLIGLPERVYNNDIVVKNFTEPVTLKLD